MLSPISDDEVVGRVRSGDTESYGVLATRYHARLCRVARRVLNSDADAEDAVQGAHLLALTHLDQYAGGSNYFRWMYSIVVNEALTRIRKDRRTANIGQAYEDMLSSWVRGPEQQVVDRDVENILERAAESLPTSYRPVFRCREIEDLTTAETGERLGLSDACVKTRLFRAKAILRLKLREVLKDADLERPARDRSAAVPGSGAAAPHTSTGARTW